MLHMVGLQYIAVHWMDRSRAVLEVVGVKACKAAEKQQLHQLQPRRG